jgi:hypothetical protein
MLNTIIIELLSKLNCRAPLLPVPVPDPIHPCHISIRFNIGPSLTRQHRRECYREYPGRGWAKRSSERAGQWRRRQMRTRRQSQQPRGLLFIDNVSGRLPRFACYTKGETWFTYAGRSQGRQVQGHQLRSTGRCRTDQSKAQTSGAARARWPGRPWQRRRRWRRRRTSY